MNVIDRVNGLLSTDRARLIHPQHHPVEHENAQIWVRGEGAYLFDIEGRAYIDGLSGMWNVAVGHGRRELVEAATAQLGKLAFATSYIGATNLPAIALAERLKQITPKSIEAFFFVSSGSEATETSIRTARWFWRALGRPSKLKIIAREYSYHGSTIAASSATGVDEFSKPFGPRLPGFLHIPSPYPYRFEAPPGSSPGLVAADLLEQAILREGAETVAAFIAEPVQGGGGGVIVPPPEYFGRIREICDRYDVLLIADEVITGFGRTGRWFALEHWGVAPDILQFAKGITSGYVPLGGIGVSSRIKAAMDEVAPADRWMHGLTNSGHPVCCAVALANIKALEDERLVDRAAALGKRLLDRLRPLEGLTHVGEVRGLGLLAGIELVADKATKTRFPPARQFGKRVRAELFKRGLYTRVLDDVICLAPPFVIAEQDIDRVSDIVQQAINAATAQLDNLETDHGENRTR